MRVEIKHTSHALYILISNIRLTNIAYQMVKMNIRLQYKRIMFSDVGWVSDYVLKEKKKNGSYPKKQQKNIELRPLLKKINELRKKKTFFFVERRMVARKAVWKKKKKTFFSWNIFRGLILPLLRRWFWGMRRKWRKLLSTVFTLFSLSSETSAVVIEKVASQV